MWSHLKEDGLTEQILFKKKQFLIILLWVWLKIEKDSNGLHFSFLQPLQLSSQTISKIFPSFTLITKLNKGTNSSWLKKN